MLISCHLILGINDVGLYRVVGVSSKVQKLLTLMIGKFQEVFFTFFPFQNLLQRANKVRFKLKRILTRASSLLSYLKHSDVSQLVFSPIHVLMLNQTPPWHLLLGALPEVKTPPGS